MHIHTFEDVVKEIQHAYSIQKKNLLSLPKDRRKGTTLQQVYIEICQTLFSVWGAPFGFTTFSAFMGGVSNTRYRLRKEASFTAVSPIRDNSPRKSLWRNPTEGDGAVFTLHQIASLNLNPDSYC